VFTGAWYAKILVNKRLSINKIDKQRTHEMDNAEPIFINQGCKLKKK